MAKIWQQLKYSMGLPGWLSGKESACQCRRHKRLGFNPSVMKIPWSRKWQPTPVSLPGESHGQKSLTGYSPWGHKESDVSLNNQLRRKNIYLGHYQAKVNSGPTSSWKWFPALDGLMGILQMTCGPPPPSIMLQLNHGLNRLLYFYIGLAFSFFYFLIEG